ncbi:MAG: sugar ABC transporter permease [Anaerolineae bacterium]|nr:sugar ABC transporter permease [Anaerolineae bacterium]MDW8100434.1 sugar ABC transporter permease [Anaerolineae bacterium]
MNVQWKFALLKPAQRRYLLFLALVAPAFLLRFATAAYPILQTIYLGFTNLDLIKNTNAFIGLRNYLAMANDYGVRGALSFTVTLVVSSTVLDLVLGMLVALLLNTTFRGTGFARTINLIPWAIPTIVAGYAFRWLLEDQFGLIPYWINLISGARVAVFISPILARVVVVLVHVWKDAGFMAFVFLAGLQGIPPELYDAARVDGANAWQRFWRITLPLVMPLAITMGLFRLVWSLGSFDLVYGLTQGGPGVATSVLALQIFREGIMFFKFGFASAISVVLLILVAIIGVVGLWLFRKAEVTY